MHEIMPSGFLIIALFIIGYICITLEHIIKINKATIALMMAILTWSVVFVAHPCPENTECFLTQLAEISQIVFFLMGALAIVEIISMHNGFSFLASYIQADSKKKLLWLIGIVTFFLSSILDNLTTTIVMITLLGKMLPRDNDRLVIGAGVVIAANAGGAWTPIGDVTTTMLWIGGQLSTQHMMPALILPSIVSMVVSFFFLSFFLKGQLVLKKTDQQKTTSPFEKFVFCLGVSSLVFVPIFKLLTGLPPLMGMFFGLSVLWIVTDWVHGKHPDREHLKVPSALSKIDVSSTLFFLGILLCIGAMSHAGILDILASWLDRTVGNTTWIATIIGLASAVVDNVPLVAATMEMYPLANYPADSKLWDLIAFCAGTGGSILIIGSAAGVMYMGIEKVDFFWYFKRISVPALLGYLAGIAVYLIF